MSRNLFKGLVPHLHPNETVILPVSNQYAFVTAKELGIKIQTETVYVFKPGKPPEMEAQLRITYLGRIVDRV